MSKLIVLCGVPGSGKSYFSHSLREQTKGHVYIISSDQLRDLITGNQQNLSEDAIMWKMYYELAKVYSADPKGLVILDATNSTAEYRINKTKEIKKFFDKIALVVFDIDKEIVYRQNLERPFPVPNEVLEKFFTFLELPTEKDYQYFNEVYVIKDNNFQDVLNKIVGE